MLDKHVSKLLSADVSRLVDVVSLHVDLQIDIQQLLLQLFAARPFVPGRQDFIFILTRVRIVEEVAVIITIVRDIDRTVLACLVGIVAHGTVAKADVSGFATLIDNVELVVKVHEHDHSQQRDRREQES